MIAAVEVALAGETPDRPASPDKPAGVLQTFVFCDIRGYTAYTREQGDEAAAALASRFAELVGELAPDFDGRLLQLRGDEALIVFASARQALRFALALQGRVADEELPRGIGVGLDAGEAVAVADGYRGGALNRAARLCALAGPGDVLASDGVVHLAGESRGNCLRKAQVRAPQGLRRAGHARGGAAGRCEPAASSPPRGPGVEARPSGGAGRASGSRCSRRGGPDADGWWKRAADGRSADHRHVGPGGVRCGTRELARQFRFNNGQAQRVDRRPDGVGLRHRRAVALRPRPEPAVPGRGRPRERDCSEPHPRRPAAPLSAHRRVRIHLVHDRVGRRVDSRRSRLSPDRRPDQPAAQGPPAGTSASSRAALRASATRSG